MRETVAKVIKHVLSIAELETVSIWATCLRFCLFDRHPRHTSWLTQLVLDDAIPSKGELDSTSVLVCKKLLLLKTVVKELSWCALTRMPPKPCIAMHCASCQHRPVSVSSTRRARLYLLCSRSILLSIGVSATHCARLWLLCSASSNQV